MRARLGRQEVHGIGFVLIADPGWFHGNNHDPCDVVAGVVDYGGLEFE